MTKDEEKKVKEESTQRFYNTKAMVCAVSVVGVGGYLLGKKRGIKVGYMAGLKDGVVQGIANGALEGYVNAISDVASVMRNTQE